MAGTLRALSIRIVILITALLFSGAMFANAGTERKTVDVDEKALATYVGQYELAPNFLIIISKNSSHLFAQATGQGKVEIYPESETKFFYKIVDAQIEFVKNDSGKVKELVLFQNGEHHAKKISDKLPEKPKTHTVDEAVLKDYIGKYELLPNFIIAITIDEGRLYAQATGQQKLALSPESETKFFFDNVDAQITFIRNDSGKVSELILHQNGDRHAVKK